MSAVYAMFADVDAVQTAVELLRAQGVGDREITIISAEPLESHEFSQHDEATWMFKIAAAGGLVGLGFAFWLTRTAERAWPIQTGGMPIVAMWPNLIIMFELTMLFAVLTTVGTLLVTARLPGRREALYDLDVAKGLILVGLENPRHPIEMLAPALTSGGGELKTRP